MKHWYTVHVYVYMYILRSMYFCTSVLTVKIYLYTLFQSAWMFLETVATFASLLVDEVAIIGFWQHCVGQHDGMSGMYTPTHLIYVCTPVTMHV